MVQALIWSYLAASGMATKEFGANAAEFPSMRFIIEYRVEKVSLRVEIHRPGTLPNGLQVEDITNGTSMPRNNFLFSNAIYLLPYTGAGSGIIEISAVNL